MIEPLVLFFAKSYIGQHVRRLKSGKVVTVAAYYDKRMRKGTEHAESHGHDLSHLDADKAAQFEKMHQEQHFLHHYQGHALRKRIAEHAEAIQHYTDIAKAHRDAGREVEATKAINAALKHKSDMLRHQKELADIDAKVAGIGAMKEKLVAGSGKLERSTDDTHAHYAKKVGDRWRTSAAPKIHREPAPTATPADPAPKTRTRRATGDVKPTPTPRVRSTAKKMDEWSPEHHLKLVADTPAKLRGMDLDRLFESLPDGERHVQAMRDYLLARRPDLAPNLQGLLDEPEAPEAPETRAPDDSIAKQWDMASSVDKRAAIRKAAEAAKFTQTKGVTSEGEPIAGPTYRGLLVRKEPGGSLYEVFHVGAGKVVCRAKTAAAAKILAYRLGENGFGELAVDDLRSSSPAFEQAATWIRQHSSSANYLMLDPVSEPDYGPIVPLYDQDQSGLSKDASNLIKMWADGIRRSLGKGAKEYGEAVRAVLEGRVSGLKPSAKEKFDMYEANLLGINPPPVKTSAQPLAKTPEEKLAVMKMTAAKRDVRFFLEGALLDRAKGRMVSTDGNRMFIVDGVGSTIDQLMAARPELPSGSDAILNFSTRPTAGTGQVAVWHQGRYPNIDQVTPKPSRNQVEVDAESLAARANGVALAMKYTDLKAPFIALKIGDDGVGMNAQYLVDAANQMRRMGYDRFTVDLGAEPGTTAIALRSPDGKATAVIMPMEISRMGFNGKFTPKEQERMTFKPIDLADHHSR